MDKRFWSGAVVVLTVVVAGASALPRLLLQPAVEASAEVVPPVPFVSRAAQPVAQSDVQPGTATPAAPTPVTADAKLANPAPPTPVPVAKPPQPAPQVASPPALPSAPKADASPFPPVQPVDVADQPGAPPRPAADAAPTQTREASAAPQGSKDRSERRRETVRVAAKPDRSQRRRHIRPAAYPIREFLAWRR
jgi:hypothetical protein